MADEVVEGSIEVTKLKKPERIGRYTYRYIINFVTLPYGTKSRMVEDEHILARDKKDAEEWVKVLKKDVVKLKGMM